MKASRLRALGIHGGESLSEAREAIRKARESGFSITAVHDAVEAVAERPREYVSDLLWGELARVLVRSRKDRVELVPCSPSASWHKWGYELDPNAVIQMENACKLPISIVGALMPDAHVGYGLPIGGVLATDNVVIPYAVGVDIACRVKLSVLDMPVSELSSRRNEIISAIEVETRFGVGVGFSPPRRHKVMRDSAWSEVPILQKMREKAVDQLGTSGGGNHFVEFGLLNVYDDSLALASGQYVALMTHSGSRGTGESVAKYYSNLARQRLPELPEELRHLAWFDMDSDEGAEYWRAMTLMGRYSAANHQLIHDNLVSHIGAEVLAVIENHHNFAWREKHNGKKVIIHRKGAIPAAKGQLGVIPGSMTASSYVVKGKGNPLSLNSAAHGAGRAMSRSEAARRFSWENIQEALKKSRVHLISAGLDEAPMAYKNIERVMDAQDDLVERVARFNPRLVKMAPSGRIMGRRGKKKKGNRK
ncbi:RtcB family protein [Pseudodesulfovibrio sp. zrk46]|uniref:RtcB family protein n=1 Tax=Pseudodesulfovibrio sp. zrk46 TaxID=2725288 RepID=UPI001448FF82|nr:RtcB family protein [Pseudodesulfovibrio sp. zrk46]QJB58478.1 RtcB family protein [Pseudodesulfovibrio sp. zrk46]